jgi:hypothetical protein
VEAFVSDHRETEEERMIQRRPGVEDTSAAGQVRDSQVLDTFVHPCP